MDDGSKFPLLDIEKGNIMELAIVDDPMCEYISDGYYLHDISRNTERRIERLVGQAAKYFERDSLWVQLLAATPSNAPNSGVTGMTGMTGMTELRKPQTPEWTRPFLKKDGMVYPKHVRTLPPCSLNGPLHVLVINPTNTDHMLCFSIGLSAAQCISVETFCLSRKGVTDISEYTHIDDVVNSILFDLWSNSCFG
ncbi:hypothetical protein BASA60_003038 [Batrachochytrium salamandrivorans]|nr:hypothetical protein BASA60_003038 [Batrachochytrium salamandrivorans]